MSQFVTVPFPDSAPYGDDTKKINKLKAKVADLEADLKEAVDMLKKFEYIYAEIGEMAIYHCCLCGKGKDDGHKPDCKLNAIIQKHREVE